jgi:hypothetical protein
MATIIPIYNGDQNQQVPYNYPYPPNYTSMAEGGFDKPPTYEQTLQEGISETNTNNDNLVEHLPATLPVAAATPSFERPIEPRRNQF